MMLFFIYYGDDVNMRLQLGEVMFRPSLGLWQCFLWTYLARNVIMQYPVLLGIQLTWLWLIRSSWTGPSKNKTLPTIICFIYKAQIRDLTNIKPLESTIVKIYFCEAWMIWVGVFKKPTNRLNRKNQTDRKNWINRLKNKKNHPVWFGFSLKKLKSTEPDQTEPV